MCVNFVHKYNNYITFNLYVHNAYGLICSTLHHPLIMYIQRSQNDSTSNPPKLLKKSEYTLKHDLEMLSIPTFMYTCISYA